MEILVCGMTENQGGIEVYLANLVKKLEPSLIKLSFVKEKDKLAFEDLLIEKNCNIYDITWRRKNPIKHIKELKALLEKHPEIDLLYINAMSSASFVSAIAGKLAKKKVLVHSRNNMTANMFIHYLLRPLLNMNTDYRFACSELAGRYMFGNKKYSVISNGIDFDTFKYDKEKRREIREKYYKEQDVFVIGFVGNLTFQKNVLLLIDIFSAFSAKHDRARLMIVGDGELREQVEGAIEAHSLRDKVVILGKQKETGQFYQAFDLFLFPSRYEGFGNVLIEAQVSGLPCVCSKDVIPISTKISNNISYVELDAPLTKWREAMETYLEIERTEFIGNGDEKKYELNQAVAHIQNQLLKLIE